MYCKQLNSRSIEWSKISLDNSSFRNEAKNYKGLFLNKFERAGIYLWFGQYDIQNQALEICPNPKGRFQGLDFAVLKSKVEWYGNPSPNTHFPLFHPLGRGKEKRKVSFTARIINFGL